MERSAGAALLQTEQRAYGRALLRRLGQDAPGGHPRPWAVRGDVPYEAENCRFCAMVVVGGVRMHLPEKLFGRNWLEIRHAASGVSLTFEAMGALQSWANLSTEELDEGRAGRAAWSGKSTERVDRAAWEARWDSAATLQRREEYDWTYRTVYRGELHAAGVAGSESGRAARSVEYWLGFRPVCLCATARNPGAAANGSSADASNPSRWVEAEGPDGPISSAALGAIVEETHTKLYEDFLHDLGLASLSVRFRRHEAGWEARLRWWAVVNPTCTSQRGFPHARLCDTTYRFVDGGSELVRTVVEKQLYFDASTEQRWPEAAGLDPDAMEPFLETALPMATVCVLQLAASGAEGGSGKVPGGVAPDGAAASEGVARVGEVMLRQEDSPVLLGSSDTGLTAYGWVDRGSMSVLGADGQQLWCSEGAGVSLESLAFCSVDGETVLLTSGTDGKVHARSAADGAPVGEAVTLEGQGADRQIRGCCVVQRIRTTSACGGLIAAACGRSVFGLTFEKKDQLVAATPRAALPSMIVDLAFASSAGCLAVATTAAGVFLWEGAALIDTSAPPSRSLSFGGSCVAIALSSGAECVATTCTDRTLRLWSAADLVEDEDETEPMTVGGFSVAQIESVSVARSKEGSVALAAADGAGGVVHWELSAAKERLWPQRSMGVESGRGVRLSVGGAGGNVTATTLALPRAADGRARIGCGYADGSVRVLLAPLIQSGSTEWECELQLKQVVGASANGFGGGAVEQLAWAGGRLYATTDDGAVLSWPAALEG